MVGVIVGAFITPWLPWFLQSKQSLVENKKAEYKELLDTLGSCVHELHGLKETPAYLDGIVVVGSLLWEGINRRSEEAFRITQKVISILRAASRVFEDRLFIDDTLRKENVREKWEPIERMAMLPGAFDLPTNNNEVRFNGAEFRAAWETLAREIRRIAREDIG